MVRVLRAAVAACALLAAATGHGMSKESEKAAAFHLGHIVARPHAHEPDPHPATGTRPLDQGGRRDGLLHVPPNYRPGQPAPVMVLFHGAGGSADDILLPFLALADDSGTILVAPSALGRSWDIISDGQYGADVRRTDQALESVFDHFAVDPTRIGIGGFSDGASYALSLGVINGALFTHVLGFSPGFLSPTRTEDAPRLFIAHGIGDTVLPIDHCSRKMVPRLLAAGYEVDYHEFDGGHLVPPDMARAGFSWFLGSPKTEHVLHAE